jgi:hypothetical protein
VGDTRYRRRCGGDPVRQVEATVTYDGGGPAFPQGWDAPEYDQGMTIRDYFAAAALQGRRLTLPPLTSSERVATLAYLDADAMLAERDKPKGTK